VTDWSQVRRVPPGYREAVTRPTDLIVGGDTPVSARINSYMTDRPDDTLEGMITEFAWAATPHMVAAARAGCTANGCGGALAFDEDSRTVGVFHAPREGSMKRWRPDDPPGLLLGWDDFADSDAVSTRIQTWLEDGHAVDEATRADHA
jgi:hypothetical protein